MTIAVDNFTTQAETFEQAKVNTQFLESVAAEVDSVSDGTSSNIEADESSSADTSLVESQSSSNGDASDAPPSVDKQTVKRKCERKVDKDNDQDKDQDKDWSKPYRAMYSHWKSHGKPLLDAIIYQQDMMRAIERGEPLHYRYRELVSVGGQDH